MAQKPEQDPGFEDLQHYLMNNLLTPGSRVACPINEEDDEEEKNEK